MQKIGNQFSIEQAKKEGREFYSMKELVDTISKKMIVCSWGAHGWTNIQNYALRFKVQGHHYKGHIIIVVNFSDYFDIYLVKGPVMTIKEVFHDVDLSQLIDVIDKRVEYIPEYKQ